MSSEFDSRHSAIDRENPWPGLAPFTEDQSGFFHGRGAEIRALARLMERKPLTVLFGQSGLGKSSLLMAGVFPRLRPDSFCPIYIRLDHSPGALSLTEQVKAVVSTATAAAGRWTRPGTARPGETLWEFFHHRDDRLVDAGDRTIVPVLVFDQFEELFTLGAAAGAQRDRAVAFMSELAELVENRPSEQLVARLEHSAEEMDAFDFGRADYRVCIALREDYLPHLEGLKTIMPALMENRMRLTRMTGVQALEAVIKPGGALVTPEVAQAIVEFVSGARGGSAERLAEVDVEPPLLSVICRELNERRRALGQAQISADLVSGNRREILNDFYERSVADLADGMRAFVEDRLLTKSGFRDNFALETALEIPGVTRPLIDTLVTRRLLRIEDHLGVPRVELSHDVLAEVVRASRDARQQRAVQLAARQHARRQRWVIAGLAAAVVVIAAGAYWRLRAQRAAAEVQRVAAERALRLEAHRASQTDLLLASRLLDEDKVSDGLAHLVRAARRDPENPVLAPRLLSTLVNYNYLLPVGAPLALPAGGVVGVVPADGDRVIFAQGADRVIRMIDIPGWRVMREFRFDQGGHSFSWSVAEGNSRVLVVGFEDGSIAVYDTHTGQLQRELERPTDAPVRRVYPRVSRNGRWVAVGVESLGRAWLWETESGKLRSTFSTSNGFVRFSPNGEFLLTRSGVPPSRRLQLCSVPDATVLKDLYRGNFSEVIFSPDGQSVAVRSVGKSGDEVQLVVVATGARTGPEMRLEPPGGNVTDMLFSPDGRRLVITKDRLAHVFDVTTGRQLAALPLGSFAYFPTLSQNGKLLLTPCIDGLARLWDLETGKLRAVPTLQQDGFALAGVSRDGTQVVLFGRSGMVHRLAVNQGAAESLVLPRQLPVLAATFARGAPHQVLRLLAHRAEAIDVASGRAVAGGFAYPQALDTTRATLWLPTHYVSPDQKVIVARVRAADAWISWTRGGDGAVTREVILEGTQKYLSGISLLLGGELLALTGDKIGPQGLGLGIWSLESGKQVTLFTRPEGIRGQPPSRARFSPDGRMIGYRTADGVLHFCDYSAGTERFVLRPPGAGGFASWRFSPDGQRIVTGDGWGGVQFWDAADGRLVKAHSRHRDTAYVLVFSPDGRTLLSRSIDGTAQLWNATTGVPVGSLLPHASAVSAVAFSHDGRRIATGTSNGDVRIWDVATSQPLTEPRRHEGSTSVDVVEFSPDGRFLLTDGPPNGPQRIWAMPPEGGGVATPGWLLRLATACASKRLTDDGEMVAADEEVSKIAEVRREIAALPADAPFAEWARWFLADRATRSIAPGFTITPAEAKELAAPDPLAEMTARDDALYAQGKYAEAEPLERQMLAWVIERDGEGALNVSNHQIKLARTLLQLGKFEEAESLGRASLAVREKSYGPDSFQVASNRGIIASALAGQRRFADAEPLLIGACEMMRRLGAHTSTVAYQRQGIFERASSLIQLYEATGRPEKAEEWRKFLATIALPPASPPSTESRPPP